MSLRWTSATVVTELAPGVLRYLPPGLADPLPFPAYVQPPTGHPVDPPVPPEVLPLHEVTNSGVLVDPQPSLPAVPEFATWGNTPLIRIAATERADVMGLGEVCGPLVHTNRRVRGATADTFAYDRGFANLYQAHPWLVGLRPDGSAFGVLVETTWAFDVDVKARTVFALGGPPAPVVVVEADDLLAVVERLTDLVGRMPMLPRWALGYQQSRFSYAPDERVRDLAAELRSRRLPCDVIWVDIDYMDGYRVFTFDPAGFPDPGALNDDLHDLGFRSAWMIDPGIKVDPGYDVYDAAVAGDHVLRDADGEVATGLVWPGEVVYPDFTRTEVREWWADLYPDFLDHGIDAVWNDMNEPTTIEDCPDQALPSTVRHEADDALGGPGDHARYRNLYGMLMTEASRDGITAARPDTRPFLLTRSTFLGGHRHAATWTGDNVSSWEHLAWSIPMALNLGLSGQAMTGPDIGGFVGDCDGPLLARWMGIGCLLPFARNHAMKGSVDQEPWAFGEAVERTCRRALERRMRLLPYLYTCAVDASLTGRPIVRPAALADLDDPDLRGVDTAFLLGGDLFVRCDVDPLRRGRLAPVPAGWVRVDVSDDPTDDADPDLPRLYLRPGAALPLGPLCQWSDEVPLDELDLVVADPSTPSSGELHEDDGVSDAWAEGGFRRTRFDVRDGVAVATRVEGDWPEGTWSVTVRGPRSG